MGDRKEPTPPPKIEGAAMMTMLGKQVRDRITGFTGVATARSEYLNGCVRILVEAKEAADGKLPSDWFDEQRIEYVEAGDGVLASAAKAGGPPSHEAPRH